MANLTGNPSGPFATTLRQLETTDPAHPNTWNPNYQQLITNDAFLKNLIDTILQAVGGHTHSGVNGDGPKIPITSLAEDVATQAELNAHIGSRGSAHAVATSTQDGFMSAADKAKSDNATSAAVANTLMQRDSAGRAKVAAPVAADDIARKDTVDALLGVNNQSVNLLKALNQKVDTRTTELTFTNGDLTQVTEKDGTTVVKTTDLVYSSGRLTQVVESVGGKTITQTLNYDASGNLQSVTRSVV
jgi:YD repeat-containing protein